MPRALWAVLAVALSVVGFAAASCGSGNGQAGSSLSSALSAAGGGPTGGGPSLPGSGLPTTSTPPTTSTETVTTTTPVVTSSSTSVTLTTANPPTTTDTAGTGSNNGVSGWVYALIGAAVVALIAVIAWLIRRGRKPAPAAAPVPTPKPLAERQAILLAEVERRLQSGWTVVSQTADTAMLERSGEVTRVTVDEYGTLHEIPSPPGGGR